MTAQDHGLAGKLFLASQVLVETKAIPELIPLDKIKAAIDPTYLQQYVQSHSK